MEFDLNFPKKSPFLSETFPENPEIKLETSITVPLQQTSALVRSPLNNTLSQNQDNFHHYFQNHHHLIEANHHPGFEMGCPSSSNNTFSRIPTLSMGDPSNNWSSGDLLSLKYPMDLSSNNTGDSMHGYLNKGKGILDFSQKIPTGCCASSQPQVGPSLSLPLGNTLTQVNLGLQVDLSCTAEIWNDHQGTHQKTVTFCDKEKENKVTRESTNIAHDITTIKSQWTPDEDKVLLQLVRLFGPKKWSHVATFLKGRNGKQCRERWHNHLRPNIKKDSWTEEEDKMLIEAHKEVGNKWVEIARRLPGRTENTVKNHWNAVKRRQITKRQKNWSFKSNGTSLPNYIMHVTAVATEKKSKKSMNKMN
ncbi:hypothetical protein RIF29_38502 [Crotalaria pallida]|uniref:Uncharacterized protein n=1 Tax=Crotalaria pallida TaxID=3830 RepID=A0AAN9HPS0_CROPI